MTDVRVITAAMSTVKISVILVLMLAHLHPLNSIILSQLCPQCQELFFTLSHTKLQIKWNFHVKLYSDGILQVFYTIYFFNQQPLAKV